MSKLAFPGPTGRARDFGVPFEGEAGPFNSITDVDGIRVGHRTLIEGSGADAVRTGVSAIVFGPPDRISGISAGLFVFNGTGEMTGSHLVEESGALFGPILLSGTLSVGAARDGALVWAKKHLPSASDRFSRILPVVAETFDGRLHDAWGFHLKPEHAVEALDQANEGPVQEGAVGGGTGMIAFGFKGGIGTASRKLRFGEADYVVGTLAQCNFGRREELTIRGTPIGRLIDDLLPEGIELTNQDRGSLIVIIATNAPFDASGLKRLARRAALGMGRLGVCGDATSGDIFLAVSTAAEIALDGESSNRVENIPPGSLDPFAVATVDAVEEAIINALFAGETMEGCGGSLVHGLPNARVASLLKDGYQAGHRDDRS
ncbi:DmpA family aminopeptidase [Sphingosinicella rhizophila]|uniref:P1 family peptidase n=1 Tax=Sphingosinicella rhizophila TaxID=3050082 RepID=A0ABU3Q787_9SPHN|nr:P1 family peptidase [Sphingosinicella sp. GR2756]MDT9598810.1 P1 family peptidase [Sphingosinicella sp. GR2756]